MPTRRDGRDLGCCQIHFPRRRHLDNPIWFGSEVCKVQTVLQTCDYTAERQRAWRDGGHRFPALALFWEHWFCGDERSGSSGLGGVGPGSWRPTIGMCDLARRRGWREDIGNEKREKEETNEERHPGAKPEPQTSPWWEGERRARPTSGGGSAPWPPAPQGSAGSALTGSSGLPGLAL